MVPLLPLIQAIPLHVETTRSHIKDLLAENVTLRLKPDLDTSGSKAGLDPANPISDKPRKKRPSSPSTTATPSSPLANKRPRKEPTSEELSHTIDETARSLLSGNDCSQRNVSPSRSAITLVDGSDDSNASQPKCPNSTVFHAITETSTQDATSNAQIPARPPVLPNERSPSPSLAKAPSAVLRIPCTIAPQAVTSSTARLGIQHNRSFRAPAAPSLLTPSRHNAENKVPTPPASTLENQKVAPSRLCGAKGGLPPTTNTTTKAPIPVTITRRQTRAQTLRADTPSISSSGSNKPPVAISTASGHKSRPGNVSSGQHGRAATPNNIVQRQATDVNVFRKIVVPTGISEITRPIRERRSPFVSIFVLHISCLFDKANVQRDGRRFIPLDDDSDENDPIDENDGSG